MTAIVSTRNRLLVARGCSVLLLIVFPLAHAAEEEPKYKVTHSPKQPKSGEPVLIKVSIPVAAEKIGLVLQYQVVEPGKYVAVQDPGHETEWTDVELSKTGADSAGRARAALTATLPAELHQNRDLVRYRIYSPKDKEVIAPPKDDAQRNYAYFVYDGIPEWRAAIKPNGGPRESEVITFSTDVMRSVQAYHLISTREAVENVTWRERKHLGDRSRHDYNYTGTLVSGDKVYDHVRFRARGGNWRHAMGKNMWKVDFNKGHHLEARDNFGGRYETKWNKLNLGACIQQATYGMRGEHGMFEAVAYRLFNLAGVEAPHTHWVQFRIVDSAQENPADQYSGDFWGLYLATEEVDEDFLKEHSLPLEGNLYKMDLWGPTAEYTVDPGATDLADLREFVKNVRANPKPDWWRTNVDLDRYYSYRAIVECIHHYDIGQGKNYFFFNNLKAKRWQVVPWDVDLTWTDDMYGNGAEPFYRAGLLETEPFKSEYHRRLAEIRDLLFNPEQTGALLDEYAANISAPGGAISMVHADRAKWDFHPIMSSQLVTRGKADPGRFYESSPTGDFAGMVKLMKQYIVKRGQWIDQTLLADAAFAVTPAIAPNPKPDLTLPKLKLRLASEKSVSHVRWRLAEVSGGEDHTRTLESPGKYEINALWEATEGRSAEVPTDILKEGHTYRVRACVQNAQGRWSRWSTPLQVTVPARR